MLNLSDSEIGVLHEREHSVMRPARTGSPRISSGQLLAGARDLAIEHAGQEYRLHLTRNNKLILTK